MALFFFFVGAQQITGVHYQTLTSDQLKNAQQFVAIPVTTPQSQVCLCFFIIIILDVFNAFIFF